MSSDQRKLTSPFELTPKSSKDHFRVAPPVVPSLRISPPQNDESSSAIVDFEELRHEDHSNDAGENTTSTNNNSRMAEIFKNKTASSNTNKFSKLSLKTVFHSDNGSTAERVSNISGGDRSQSDRSGIFTTSPTSKDHSGNSHRQGRIRSRNRHSLISNSRSRSRSVNSRGVVSPQQPSRSAKVLSLIAADDMDEFEDIQNGFRTAIDDKGFAWLPQLNPKVDEDGQDTKNELDQESEHPSGMPENFLTSIGISTGASRSKDNIHWEGSLFPEEETLDETKRYKNTNNNNVKSDDEIKLDDVNVKSDELLASLESIELPDFDRSNFMKKRKPLLLYGNSLSIIPPDNIIRKKLAEIHLKSSYQVFYQFLLTLLTVFLAYRTYNPTNLDFLYRFHSWEDYIIFILFFYFTLHDITKIIAFGFWDDSQMFRAYGRKYITIFERIGIVGLYQKLTKKYGSEFIQQFLPFKIPIDDHNHKLIRGELTNKSVHLNDFSSNKKSKFDIPRAFARSSWNRIDMVSTFCFWLGLFVSIKGYDKTTGIRVFKPLAAFRILNLVNTDTGISSILRALKYGIPQLVNVSSMLVYFWIFFGILGVFIFQGSLRRRCVWINPNDPNDTYQYDMQFCGGHLDADTGEKLPYIFADGSSGPAAKGFLCPKNSKCISNANPFNGRISFDNLVNSMELVFIVMSANTFTDLMYYTMDSDEMAASLFYIVSIFVLTIWMMNLLIAVLVSSYDLAYEKHTKKRLENHIDESFIINFTRGYWKYFQVKASSTEMPNWSKVGLAWYRKFEWIFRVLILTDFIHRACISIESTDAYIHRLYLVDRGISITLFLESILRVALHIPNPWKFLTKWSYIYDLINSIITLVISSLAVKKKISDVYFWLSIFQITRFYRIVMWLPFINNLWKSILKNGVMIWNLTSFYFFFTFLVAVIIAIFCEGMMTTDEKSDHPFAMYSLPNTFISLFIIGSTENWTDILYALQQYSPNISSAFFVSVFLIIWFVLSNSVILNIFIALISESMEVDENKKRVLQIKHYLKYIYPQKIKEYTHASLIQRIRRNFFKSKNETDSRDFKQFLMRGTAIMNIAYNMDEIAEDMKPKTTKNKPTTKIGRFVKKYTDFSIPSFAIKMFSDNPFNKKPEVIFTETVNIEGKSYILQLNEYEEEKISYLKKHPSYNYSYFLFPPSHRFRRFCQRLVPSSYGKRTDGIRFYDDETDVFNDRLYFKRIERDIFVFIYALLTILLVVTTCYVTPLYRKSKNIKTYDWPLFLDSTFISLFTVEFIVKTVADGLLFTPNAYLRNPWNSIDSLVLTSMWIYFISYVRNNGNLSRIFRGISALRALRCLTVSNTAQQTFTMVMFQGSRKIFEAALVSFTLLLPFTVWGIGLFRGKLGVCNDGDLGIGQCYGEFTTAVDNWNILMPRVYSQPYLYFDTFVASLKSLYEIISLEGWVDLLTNLMNSTGVGTPASDLQHPANAIFMILFNFLSMVFILNLFISFIINNYAETTGSAYYTSEEKAWLESQKLLSQAKPKAVPNFFELSKWRRFFYRIAVGKDNFYYAFFLQITLYVHICLLLSTFYTDKDTFKQFYTIFFTCTITILLLQEFLSLYGQGLYLYMNSLWSRVRFLILFSAFILMVASFSVSNVHTWFHNMKDFCNLLIFLFVIPQSDMLLELLETATASLPPILSLIYTWGILFLVYAMALNQIFGLTRLGPNTTNNINFRTTIKTLIVLFKCSFGEGWNYIMDDFTLEKPYCYTDYDSGYSDCGSPIYAYMLLISWNIISMYIFMNMFISLVIGNFSYVYRRGGSDSAVNKTEIRKYTDAWSEFDIDGIGELEFSLLPRLMHSFDGTFSFKIWEGRLTIKNLVKNYMEVNPNEPYDVKIDYEGLNAELDTINKVKMIQRRLHYRRFVQEMMYTNGYNGSIKFSSLLETIPLYTTYNPRDCLGIDQYVRYLYNLNKVDKYLDNERNVDVLNMIVTRWKYHLEQKSKFVDKHPTDIVTPTNPFESVNDTSEMYEVNKFQNSNSKAEFENYNSSGIFQNDIYSPVAANFGVNNFMWSPHEHHSKADEDSEA